MAKPMPMPNRAVRIGRPMAITEPKATSRMMIAAAMPISLARPELGLNDLGDGLTAELDLQAVAPGRLGGVDDGLHARGVSRSTVSWSNCTLAKPMVGSMRLICASGWSNGLTTPETCGQPRDGVDQRR